MTELKLIKLHDNLYVPDNFEKVHSYFADAEGKKEYTGVSSILGVISKPRLIQWAADMTASWIRENCGLLNTVKVNYMVGEDQLQQAVKAHTKKKEAGGKTGTDVHKLVENYIKHCIAVNNGSAMPVEVAEPMLQKFVDWSLSKQVRFLASEKRVCSPTWWVAGTLDFTCEIDGKRYVGDLKTQAKMWDRVPFYQCAAYMKMLVEMGDANYDGSVIVGINKECKLTEYYTYAHEADIETFEGAIRIYRSLHNV